MGDERGVRVCDDMTGPGRRADPAVARFHVSPDYESGFSFHWEMAGGFNDPLPWKFIVQSSELPEGPWHDISSGLENVFAWRSKGRIRVGKARTLLFRVVCDTPAGRHESMPVAPYGDLSRHEYLLGREIMRREVLHMRKMAGVECDFWLLSVYGPKCPHCLDPVTGQRRDANCRYCLGTGKYPPYQGPFRAWCTFSENSQHKLHEGEAGIGMAEDKPFQVRTVCSLPVKKNDILVDRASGKRYYIGDVQIMAELRRVPLVQAFIASEAAVTDPAYRVGV